MRKRPNRPVQLKFRWQVEDSMWNQLPREKQEHCQELLAQLLLTVAENQAERSENHERKDQRNAS